MTKKGTKYSLNCYLDITNNKVEAHKPDIVIHYAWMLARLAANSRVAANRRYLMFFREWL